MKKGLTSITIALVVVGILAVSTISYYTYPVLKEKIKAKKPVIQQESPAPIIKEETIEDEISKLQKILPEALKDFPKAKIITGKVDKNATVCKDLFVISATDYGLLENNQNTIKGRAVKIDGSFATIVSGEAPQALMLVNDKEELCLGAIFFPDNSEPLIFDAKSTIMSLLTIDKTGYEKIQKLESFQKYSQFLENELKKKTLTSITVNIYQEGDIYTEFLDELMGELMEKK